ncbi:hypothetical protein JCM17846_04910 [Iodidimonas nitroreducens]|uniref:Flagellin N-terminal domain-containing protein n=1 Tax=Iodidimonas nitroreducens TaxID=1236968 RepID=A0A5A7N6W7_9PROT|nr:flagellin [Iodidimonas nitroreducens]GER02809.1 hypothetical protein JCM17846_04910 [Iodidimonas nitroreducens]
MAFSVNTNAGAFLALQSLSSTNRELATTQDRISTGLEVASVRDDSATFLIAQNQRSDLAGINAARSSLDRASSTLDVGVNAAEAVSDLLISAREIAVSVQDTGLDQASVDSLNRDFSALVSQIDSIVGQAEFNGVNIVDGGGQNVDAITGVNRAGDISRISVAGVDLRTNSTTATSTLIPLIWELWTIWVPSMGHLMNNRPFWLPCGMPGMIRMPSFPTSMAFCRLM